MSKATNRSRSVAADWPVNTAQATAAKSCAGSPSRSATATSSPSNVVPGATSMNGASSDPRRAVRSAPWRDHPRTSPQVPTSIRSRKPSLSAHRVCPRPRLSGRVLDRQVRPDRAHAREHQSPRRIGAADSLLQIARSGTPPTRHSYVCRARRRSQPAPGKCLPALSTRSASLERASCAPRSMSLARSLLCARRSRQRANQPRLSLSAFSLAM